MELEDLRQFYLAKLMQTSGENPVLEWPELISEDPGRKEMGPLSQLGGMVGLQMLASRAANLLPPQYRLPALGVSAATGGLWGLIKSYMENRPWSEYPKEVAGEGAFFAAPGLMMAKDIGGEAFKALTGQQTPGEAWEKSMMTLPFLYLVSRGIMKPEARESLEPFLYRGVKEALRRPSEMPFFRRVGESVWKQLEPEAEQLKRFALPFASPGLERKAGARTIYELLRSPYERAEMSLKKAGAPEEEVNIFWEKRRHEGVGQEAAQDFGKRFEALTPKEKIFSIAYLKGGMRNLRGEDLPEGMKQKLESLVEPFTQGVGPKLRVSKEDEAYMLDKFKTKVASSFKDIPTSDFAAQEVLDKVGRHTDPKDISNSLQELVNNPLASGEAKSLARALYDFGARGIGELERSWNSATVSYTKARVLESPHACLDEVEYSRVKDAGGDWNYIKVVGKGEPGYLGQFFDPFKGRYLDRNVYHSLIGLEQSPVIGGRFLQWVNKWVMHPFKLTKAVAAPPTLSRNIFGNFWQNDTWYVNPLPILRMDVYNSVLKDTWMGGRYTKQLEDLAGINFTNFIRTDVKPWEDALRKSTNMWDTALKWFDYGLSPFTKAFEFSEKWCKVAKFKWNLDAGMAPLDAAKDAIRATIHYGEVGPGIRALRETVFPFATFQSNMAITLAERMIRNPVGMAKWVAIPWAITNLALKNLSVNEREWEEIKDTMPAYLKRGIWMVMPSRDAKGRFQLFNLTWWLPGIGDAAEYSSTIEDPTRWLQNPIFTMAADITRNRQGGTNIPIWQDWDTPVMRTAKMLGHIYKTLMPTWMPGFGEDTFPLLPSGIYWEQFMDAVYHERPQAQTPAQATATQFGLRITPMDETVLAAKRQARVKRIQSDMQTKMRWELRNAVTPQEQDEITSRYAEYIKRLPLI